MMKRFLLFFGALFAVTAALGAMTTQGQGGIYYATGDTARAICRWTPSGDASGPATSYVVNWLTRDTRQIDSLTTYPQREKTGLADTALFPLPPLGDSLMVVCTVTPKRRGRFGDSKSVQRFFGRRDGPPPAVPSVVLDTL